jgi:hypothetical protein
VWGSTNLKSTGRTSDTNQGMALGLLVSSKHIERDI